MISLDGFLKNLKFAAKRLHLRIKYREEWKWYLQENVSEWGQHNSLIRNYVWIEFLDQKDAIDLEDHYPVEKEEYEERGGEILN